MRKLLSAGIGATMLLGACGSGALPTEGGGRGGLGGDPSGRVHISTLAQYGGPPTVSAPDRVVAGVPFAVSFSTLAMGCDEPENVAEEDDGASITLTPYNRNTMEPGTFCPMYVTFVTRTDSIVFTTLGSGTVNVRGYIDGSLGTIKKAVVVVR